MNDQFKENGARQRIADQKLILSGLISLIFVFAILVGRIVDDDSLVRVAAQTDATPGDLSESEQDELNRLRDLVAQLADCSISTPTATDPGATPVPVKSISAGTAVDLGNGWILVVDGISLSPPLDGITANGQFVQVTMTVTNTSDVDQTFDFRSWELEDEQGNIYRLDHTATTRVSGPSWYFDVTRTAERTSGILYDVNAGAGPSFTLTNEDVPTVQFVLALEVRG